MKHREANDKLRQVGLTQQEIWRLEDLRRKVAAERDKRELATSRRLQFIRYLVTTGRLTEQVA